MISEKKVGRPVNPEIEKLRQHPKVIAWLNEVAKGTGSKGTEEYYPRFLFYFLTDTKTTIEDWEEMLKRDPKDVEQRVTAWWRSLETIPHPETGKVLKRGTSSLRLRVIRSFFRFGLGYRFIGKTPLTWTVTQGFLPNTEQLQKICDVAGPRLKAAILAGKDLGWAPRDLLNLTLESGCPCHGTVKEQLERGDWVHIQIRREKTKTLFDSYLGPEAISAIKTALSLDNVSEGAVFRTRDGRSLTYDNYITSLRGAAQRAGLPKTTPYCLRDFFITNMKLCGVAEVKELIIEYWAGHKLPAVKSAYFIPPVKTQLDLYQRAYKAISVYGGREGRDLKKEREAAAEALRKMGIDPERWLRVAKEEAGREFTIDEEITKLNVKAEVEKMMKSAKKEQQIVDEDILSNHLRHGWRFVACLLNGKCVVEKI